MTNKILLLDIETAPNVAYVWGLFDQNITHNQLEASSYVLCWSAKWLGRHQPMQFASAREKTTMLPRIHALLHEADVVIHYNGLRFDIPTLNKEFINHDMPPPSPYRQLDLMVVVKHAFKFTSNKLDYVAQALGLGSKVRHPGFELWIKCMRGDTKAWKIMERYNRQDVVLLEKLYHRLRPWIARHPNLGLFSGQRPSCPKCGSSHVQARGSQLALTRIYQRYQCQHCRGWFRGNKPLRVSRGERGVNIV